MKVSASVRRSSRQWLTSQMERQLLLKIANGLKTEAVKPAKDLLSGSISTQQLADADHPFARRNRYDSGRLKRGRTREIRQVRQSIGRIAKLPINRQSGQLAASMKVSVRSGGGTWKLFLNSNSPHAVVLNEQGTKHMIPRGYVEELTRRMTSQRMISRLRAIIRRTRLR